MERLYSLFALVLACAAVTVSAAGCGAKQPTPASPPPRVVLPNALPCSDLVTGKNIQLSTSMVESGTPIIFAVDDTFLVAWNDMHGRSSELFMERIDKNGAVQGASQKVVCAGIARDRTFFEDNGDTLLVWNDANTLKSLRYGAGAEAPTMLAQNAGVMAAATWGAVAWVENGELLFVSNGMPSDEKKDSSAPVRITAQADKIKTLHMAYNGSFYALVWSSPTTNGTDITLQRISPEGQKLGPPVRVSSLTGSSGKPLVAWDGNQFVVAWTNSAARNQHTAADRHHIFLSLIPKEGDTPQWTRKMDFLSADDDIGLAVTGKEYAIAWVSNIKQTSAAIFIQRLSLDGNPAGELVEVTDGTPTACGAPAVAWIGDGYGVVWHDDRSQTGNEVYFSFVGCNETPDSESAPTSATDATVK